MDIARLLQSVLQSVLRQLLRRGVNAGIDHVARGGKPEAEMTDEERMQARAGRRMARRARDAARITRRLGR
jgi:hypothetical protein